MFSTNSACRACRTEEHRNFDLTMAFQPIVDVKSRTVFAYEALVRGKNGGSAADVLRLVNDENRYTFDQQCRVRAIELAAKLKLADTGAKLSVNFMPGAVYSPAACIRRTLQAARDNNFPLDAIMFEITEGERVINVPHLRGIALEYARHGFTLALDDFGSGFSGLNLLAELEGVQILKLDGQLVRGMATSVRTAHIVAATASLCEKLGIVVIGECVETVQEMEALRSCGIRLMQGYLFSRPALEALPPVHWPDGNLAAQLAAAAPENMKPLHANVA